MVGADESTELGLPPPPPIFGLGTKFEFVKLWICASVNFSRHNSATSYLNNFVDKKADILNTI